MADDRTLAPVGSTAVQKQQKTLKDWLTEDNFKKAIAAALPKHMDADRFIRVATTATTKIPKLRQCTPESVLRCLIDLSSMGLEPDGRHAHLIPFGSDCTLIVDYKGISTLVRRSGEVSSLHCDVVREGDEFDFKYGSGSFLVHKPNLEDENRYSRKRRCAYSFVKLKDGSEDFIVWGMAQVEAIKARSKGAKSKESPWNGTPQDYDEMAKKSVFRNHSKWLPWSSEELRNAIEKDQDPIDVEFTALELPEGGSVEAAKAVAETRKAALRADEEPTKAAAAEEEEIPAHLQAILTYADRIPPDRFKLISGKYVQRCKVERVEDIPFPSEEYSQFTMDLEDALQEARAKQAEKVESGKPEPVRQGQSRFTL